MATIINNPGDNGSGSSTAWIVGILVLVLVVLAGMYFVPKYLQSQQVTPAPTAASDQNSIVPPIVNNYTTINASSTTNNSTTTR